MVSHLQSHPVAQQLYRCQVIFNIFSRLAATNKANCKRQFARICVSSQAQRNSPLPQNISPQTGVSNLVTVSCKGCLNYNEVTGLSHIV